MSSVIRHTSRPHYLVLMSVALFLAVYGSYALHLHDAVIGGAGIDLANLNQAVWSTVAGHPYHMTTQEGITSRLGLHVEPILLAMIPLYAVAPTPKTLILVQVLAIGLVAVPLYTLAHDATDRPWLAVAFPLLYLLAPSTGNTALAGFYPVAVGALPATAALAALYRRRERGALLFALLALLCREDYGLWLAGFSVLAWWWTRRRAWLLGIVGGLAWFAVAILGIMPIFVQEQQAIYWDRYGFWLEGPEAWRRHGLLDVKARYLLGLAATGGVAAVLAPIWVLPAMPTLALNLLSNFVLPVSFESYYSSLIVPTLLAAGAVGIGRRSRAWQVAIVAVLLVAGIGFHRVEARSPLVPGFRLPEHDAHSAALSEMRAEIPRDARLSASTHLTPYVSRRTVIRQFPERDDVDLLLVDVLRDLQRNPLDTRSKIFELLEDEWGVRAGTHGYLLLERNGAERTIPSHFYAFARAEHDPEVTTDVVFGDALRLVGYDVRWDYWGRPAPRLYWQALRPLERDWQLYAAAVAPDGTFVSTSDTHPPITQLWWPPSRWEPGQTYVVAMLPFDAPDRFDLAVGVGAPWNDAPTRLTTADGRDLVPLATVVRHGRGWLVHAR